MLKLVFFKKPMQAHFQGAKASDVAAWPDTVKKDVAMEMCDERISFKVDGIAKPNGFITITHMKLVKVNNGIEESKASDGDNGVIATSAPTSAVVRTLMMRVGATPSAAPAAPATPASTSAAASSTKAATPASTSAASSTKAARPAPSVRTTRASKKQKKKVS